MLPLALFFLLGSATKKAAPVQVPSAASEKETAKPFHDSKYGVRFVVPAGWTLSKKDHEVSTFRMDAPKTTARNEMRSVMSMTFNPYPLSTLSGSFLYYSVERHATDEDCQQQATVSAKPKERPDVQNIGGVNFIHDHKESGVLCLESRDDMYVAFHKGSCYRFDVVVNFFCSKVSGADDITLKQMNELEGHAADILSTISFDWDTTGATKVPPPAVDPDEGFTPIPEKKIPVPTSTL